MPDDPNMILLATWRPIAEEATALFVGRSIQPIRPDAVDAVALRQFEAGIRKTVSAPMRTSGLSCVLWMGDQ
jgi:hypothetical protein